MKKYLAYLCFGALALTGCAEGDGSGEAAEYGRLGIGCGADPTLDVRSAAAPEGAQFALTLTGEGFSGEWPTVAEYNAEAPLLKAGQYTAKVSWGDPEAEGVDKPFYSGERTVEVRALETRTETITARIANAQAAVTVTERFLRYFHAARFRLETGAGNLFEFEPETAGAYTPVYVEAGTSLTVSGTARQQSQTGVDEGPQVTFSPERIADLKLEATRPRTLHTFEFDAPDAGSATLTIALGEGEYEVVPLDVELNDDAIE